MTRKRLCDFLVASCVPEGGIYRFGLYENGEVEQLQKLPMPEPMYFWQSRDRLWVVLNAPFDESRDSGLAAYDLKSGDRLTDVICTRGDGGCHLAIDGENAYVANYDGGSLFALPDTFVQHIGNGPNPDRQASAHPHAVFFSPDKQYVLVCDLGLDTIFVYDRDLHEVSRAKVPDGAGPRHLTFSRDGRYVYCLNELSATVSVFAYGDGRLTYLNSAVISPDLACGQGKGAAIKLSRDGRYLYATERELNIIAVFEVHGERLKLIERFDSHGAGPRDFALVGNEAFAISTNQLADCMAIYKREKDGRLVYLSSVSIPAPLCVEECT